MQREFEQALAVLEYLQLQMELLEKQMENIQNAINDYMLAKKTLEEYAKVGDEDTLIPIGGGVFVYGKLSKEKKVIMNIGSGISFELGWEDAIKKIDERLKELEKAQKSTMETMEAVRNKYAQYLSYAEELQKKMEVGER